STSHALRVHDGSHWGRREQRDSSSQDGSVASKLCWCRPFVTTERRMGLCQPNSSDWHERALLSSLIVRLARSGSFLPNSVCISEQYSPVRSVWDQVGSSPIPMEVQLGPWVSFDHLFVPSRSCANYSMSVVRFRSRVAHSASSVSQE